MAVLGDQTCNILFAESQNFFNLRPAVAESAHLKRQKTPVTFYINFFPSCFGYLALDFFPLP